MLPLLHPGDRIFVDEADKSRSDLHDGDVIVFRHGDLVVIKRILAMQGETIGGDHWKVFRDGRQLEEPYVAPTNPDEDARLSRFATRKVSAGEIFVVGDNRDRSFDSRFADYGPVQLTDVLGRYSWTYWHGNQHAK